MDPFAVPLLKSRLVRWGPDEVDQFARRTGWIDDVAVIRADHTCIESTPLPWWPETDLVVARDPDWAGPAPIAAWLRKERLHRLTGGSERIHRYNATVRPNIDDETVLAYLGFFCFFVVADEGPFSLVETTTDLAGLGATTAEQYQDLMRPATVLKKSDEGYHCESVVWFTERLSLADFLVRLDGRVEMTDDEVLRQSIGSRCQFDLRFTAPPPAVPPPSPAADAS